jgi:hypothetical protein
LTGPNPTVPTRSQWVWLDELRSRYRQPLTLATIPAQEWDALADLSVDAVWLMGMWERSPAGAAVANANPDLQAEFRRVLLDYRPEDNVGSAYCVRDYIVAAHLGGPDPLRKARAELNLRGLRLVLDFVPNHVAVDQVGQIQRRITPRSLAGLSRGGLRAVQPRREHNSRGALLEIGFPLSQGRQTVHPGSMDKGTLRRCDVLTFARPRLLRRGLRRSAVGEGQLPGNAADLFMASRCGVASSSDWPPERKAR